MFAVKFFDSVQAKDTSEDYSTLSSQQISHRAVAGWLHSSCYLDCHRLVSEFDFAPAFEDHSDETTDLDYVLYLVVVRWGVHFCGWGIRRLAGPDLHRRSPDAGG